MHWMQDPKNKKKKERTLKKAAAAKKHKRREAKMGATSRADKAVSRAVARQRSAGPKQLVEDVFHPPDDPGARSLLYAMAADTIMTYDDMAQFAKELGFALLNRAHK